MNVKVKSLVILRDSSCVKSIDNVTTWINLLWNLGNHEHFDVILTGHIVYWPITINFRTCEQTSKPQSNYCCCLHFNILAANWIFSLHWVIFHKYFRCSGFSEFHNKRKFFVFILKNSSCNTNILIPFLLATGSCL